MHKNYLIKLENGEYLEGFHLIIHSSNDKGELYCSFTKDKKKAIKFSRKSFVKEIIRSFKGKIEEIIVRNK